MTKIEKHKTGIHGFDLISNGGLPQGRSTLLSGAAGSGKTVFACQFLSFGIMKAEENGVFVTFEESPDDIKRNMQGFGWNICDWEKDNKWAFVDVSPQLDSDIITGDYDLGGLIARIEYAIQKVGAKRISIDSINAIFSQFDNAALIRKELFRLSYALKKMNVTTILTAERISEHGNISCYNVEEFVADNVIILRNILEHEKRRRTIEILKFRGTYHQKGEFPFSTVAKEGIVVIPLSAMELKQKSSSIRITSGNSNLDAMCNGGIFRDSIILVSGATGTGKTLMATSFIAGGIEQGERCLLFAFEESREQFFRNAYGWGMDLEKMEKEGKFKIICKYPETLGLEDHLINIKEAIAIFKPKRVALDSLSALERISSIKGFREFVISLTSFIKHRETAGLFTAATPTLLGGTSITEAHISTITDSIILLRYVEIYGEMRRGITVLKMRGSTHDKKIREFLIDSQGIKIGKPFHSVTGILSGNFMHMTPNEMERLDSLFQEKENE